MLVYVFMNIFKIFFGIEEIATGKYWKVVSALVLGIFAYAIIESKID